MEKADFENTILLLRPKLKIQAKNLTKNNDDAEDLIQDTYFQALKSFHSLKNNENIHGWLSIILKNKFINKYRRDRRQGEFLDITPDLYYLNNSKASKELTPSDHLQGKELLEIIESLNPIIREPFKLHVEGFKYEEIAEKLSLKMGTVKSRIFFARQSLMDIIKNDKPFKNMKNNNFGHNEVIDFKKIASVLLTSGWTRKRLETCVRISEPTMTKILKSPSEDINLNGHVVQKIQNFNEQHESAILFTKQDSDKPTIKRAESSGKIEETTSDNAKKEPVFDPDQLPSLDRFWFYIGKAMPHKPSSIKITIQTE